MNASARNGSGQLAGDWATKGPEISHRVSLRRRRWRRRVAVFAGGSLALAAAVALGFFGQWHDEQRAELARQRQCLEAFLRSAEFTAFGAALDAQLVAAINFVAVRPREAQAAWPEIAAREKARHELSWTLQVLPLPISASARPERVARATREVATLLARRGVVFDAGARARARQLFLRALVPFAQEFQRLHPDRAFPALFFDRGLQEVVLAAFAARSGAGGTVAGERLLQLYLEVGPAMWQAIERSPAARLPLRPRRG